MSSKYLVESRIESWEILERLSTMIHGQIKNVFLIKDSECKMLNTVQNKDEKISHCTVCCAIPPASVKLFYLGGHLGVDRPATADAQLLNGAQTNLNSHMRNFGANMVLKIKK